MALTRLNSDTLSTNAVTDTALNSTGVTAGTYGDSSHIPRFTVDQDGRLTTASNISLANISITTLTTIGDVTIGGNLTVSGTTTTLSTETINLADNIIVLNSNATGPASINAGIEINRGSDTNVVLRWNETIKNWELTTDGSSYYNILTANSSLDASKITGSLNLGTVTSGTWQATNIGILYGGTGASTASAARTNLGLATVANTGSYTDLTNKPTLFDGVYASLSGKPTLFSGNYNDLTNKPTTFSDYILPTATDTILGGVKIGSNITINAGVISVATPFSGSYNDLTNKPTLFSGSYTDLTNKPTLVTSYNDLTDKPTLFSGSYTDLTNKPTIPAAQVQTDWNASTGLGVILNKPTLSTVATTGSYNDLTNKPSIPTVPTTVSSFTNDAGYLTSVTNITGNAATVTNGVYTSGSYSNPAWITSLAYSKLTDAPNLATVATSGSYTDLTNKPTLAFNNQYIVSGTTTNATETEIFVNGVASTRISVPLNTAVYYTFDIVGRRTDTSGDYAAFYIKGLASNIAGTTSDIGSVYEVVIARTDASFQVDVRADNTTDTINVYVTGSAGKTMSWKCSVTTTEV